MNRKPAIIFGAFLIFIGVLAIIRNLFGFDLWVVLGPLLLIALGVFLIWRPSLSLEGSKSIVKFLGDLKFSGPWTVQNQELWLFVGDTLLDFREAEVPVGINEIHLYGFVGEVRIKEPTQGALQLEANGFLTSSRIYGDKQDNFLTTRKYQSPGYDENERKVKLQCWFFVNDLRIE